MENVVLTLQNVKDLIEGREIINNNIFVKIDKSELNLKVDKDYHGNMTQKDFFQALSRD
jgi:hypothetical protein